VIVGVDFGAPQRVRDQRRKIIALAAHSTSWHSYRIDTTGMNARLLANDPPGWSAKELVSTSRRLHRGETAPSVHGSGRSVRPISPPVGSRLGRRVSAASRTLVAP